MTKCLKNIQQFYIDGTDASIDENLHEGYISVFKNDKGILYVRSVFEDEVYYVSYAWNVTNKEIEDNIDDEVLKFAGYTEYDIETDKIDLILTINTYYGSILSDTYTVENIYEYIYDMLV